MARHKFFGIYLGFEFLGSDLVSVLTWKILANYSSTTFQVRWKVYREG